MALRHQQVGDWAAPLVLAAVTALLAAGILPLFAAGLGHGVAGFNAYAWHVLGFTLWQAFLSSLVSVLAGLLLARALAARRFPGRDLLVRLLLLPQALPAIVVIIALLGLLGEAGALPGVWPIYGLPGILLAHVFFNMPLAARLLLSRLEQIPVENIRLAEQLRFTAWDTFRHVEWPVLAPAALRVGGLVFLLCAASFAVVLVLGGGPAATTLEVAIYQALRMDFDPGFAALLALAQLMVCALAVAIAGRMAGETEVAPQTLKPRLLKRTDWPSLALDAGMILLALMLLLPPLAALVASGAPHISFSPSLFSALLTSLSLGFCAALFGLCLGGALAAAAARETRPAFRAAYVLASLASLIMPPAVLATGWFVTLAPHADVGRLAPVLIILLNALMAMPFVRTLLQPAIADSLQRHDRLCASLGLSGISRLRLIELPVLRGQLFTAGLLAFILSLGDLAAVTLFGTADWVTLPALIYRQMGHYQMAEAEGTALVLALLCLALTFLISPRKLPA